MAPSYRHPGVYTEEDSGGARPIEAAGTSTAAFVGEAPLAPSQVNRLVWINNWSEFSRAFTLGESGATQTPGLRSNALSHAVYGFFLNGGDRCCVVNTGKQGSLVGDGRQRKGLDLLEESDEVAIVVVPGRTESLVYDQVLSHCEKMKDRVAVLDAPPRVKSIDALTRELRPQQSDGGFGAVYFPHILVTDPLDPDGPTQTVAPSGHVAGIYARTDATSRLFLLRRGMLSKSESRKAGTQSVLAQLDNWPTYHV